MGRLKWGKKKLAFSLSVKDKEINGSGEGTMSPRQRMGGLLEKVESLYWVFQEWGSASGSLPCFSAFPKTRPRVNGF